MPHDKSEVYDYYIIIIAEYNQLTVESALYSIREAFQTDVSNDNNEFESGISVEVVLDHHHQILV